MFNAVDLDLFVTLAGILVFVLLPIYLLLRHKLQVNEAARLLAAERLRQQQREEKAAKSGEMKSV